MSGMEIGKTTISSSSSSSSAGRSVDHNSHTKPLHSPINSFLFQNNAGYAQKKQLYLPCKMLVLYAILFVLN